MQGSEYIMAWFSSKIIEVRDYVLWEVNPRFSRQFSHLERFNPLRFWINDVLRSQTLQSLEEAVWERGSLLPSAPDPGVFTFWSPSISWFPSHKQSSQLLENVLWVHIESGMPIAFFGSKFIILLYKNKKIKNKPSKLAFLGKLFEDCATCSQL